MAACVAIGAALYFAYGGRTSGSGQVQSVARTVTTPVTRGTLSRTISASGRLLPLNDVTLGFTSSGRVTEVLVEEGQSVKAGDALVRLDDTSARLAVMRAESEYEAAKVDAPPSQIEEKRLALEVARRQLEETVIRAPFDGVVAEVLVEPGNAVGERANVIRVVDLSGYKVNVTVDESDVIYVRPGQDVTVRIQRSPQFALAGRVAKVGVLPDPSESVVLFPVEVVIDMQDGAPVPAAATAGRTGAPAMASGRATPGGAGAAPGTRAGAFGPTGAAGAGPRAAFPGGAGGAGVQADVGGSSSLLLQPGLTAEVEIVVERVENVLVVPVAAIVEAGGQSLVTRVHPDGTQENVAVVTGLSDGLRVEVRSGLEEGDTIITNNYLLYQTLLEGGPGAQATGGGARGLGFPGGGFVIRR